MPTKRTRRMRTNRGRRINDRILDELRAVIAEGVPWHPAKGTQPRGYADLIYVVTGLFYNVTDYILSKDDTEGIMELWEGLREDIIEEHIRQIPASRPWAWWHLEDREPRRVVEIDEAQLACNGGRILETEEDYLERFGLLTRQEKKTLEEQNCE